MLNQPRILLRLFLIFFLFSMHSDVIAQNQDTELSESRYIKLLEEIRKLDTKMAERIGEQNTKMAEKLGNLDTELRKHVDEKIDEVNDEIKTLRDDIAFMKGMFTTIQGITTIFGGPILVGILIAMIVNYIQNRKNTTVPNVNQNTENSEAITGLLEPEIDPKTFLSNDKINKSDVI